MSTGNSRASSSNISWVHILSRLIVDLAKWLLRTSLVNHYWNFLGTGGRDWASSPPSSSSSSLLLSSLLPLNIGQGAIIFGIWSASSKSQRFKGRGSSLPSKSLSLEALGFKCMVLPSLEFEWDTDESWHKTLRGFNHLIGCCSCSDFLTIVILLLAWSTIGIDSNMVGVIWRKIPIWLAQILIFHSKNWWTNGGRLIFTLNTGGLVSYFQSWYYSLIACSKATITINSFVDNFRVEYSFNKHWWLLVLIYGDHGIRGCRLIFGFLVIPVGRGSTWWHLTDNYLVVLCFNTSWMSDGGWLLVIQGEWR